MTLHHNSSLSADTFSLESAPRREKLYVDFGIGNAGTVYVHAVIPLDEHSPAERRAREAFNSDSLHLRYSVAIDLDAERINFAELVSKMYKGNLGGQLRKDELIRFEERDLRKLLQPLLEQGRNVFYRLFLGEEIVERYSPEDRVIIHQTVKSVFSRPQVLVIYAPSPLFPWNFLYYDQTYDSTNRASIKPEKFWGLFHEIQQEFNTTHQRVELPSDFQLLSAVDADVDDDWHTAEDHPFSRIKPTHVNSINDLGSALGNFNGHCLYFFGHAHHEDPPTQTSSWLQLRERQLTVSNMLIQFNAPRFNQIPVVAFLNGCRTSPLTKWNENTVVGFLCLRGNNRLCCVASVGELPPAFAAEFAKKFWSEFVIARREIGTALLLARKHMLHNWNNPLGLLYSLFGRVDTFIKNDSVQNGNE